MIGRPCPAGMLDREHAGNEAKNLSRSALRLQHNFLVRDELLGRGRNRFFTDDSDFRDFEYILIWIMSL